MVQYRRGMNSPRQIRGSRKVKPASKEERLESMQRELDKRERTWGPDHWLVQMQRDRITKEKEESTK